MVKLLVLFSVGIASYTVDACDEVFRLHFPCPLAVKNMAQQQNVRVEPDSFDFFYGPTPAVKNNENIDAELNVPWSKFTAQLKGMINDEADILLLEGFIFGNIATIQRAEDGQYRRLRRSLSKTSSETVTFVKDKLTRIRRNNMRRAGDFSRKD